MNSLSQQVTPTGEKLYLLKTTVSSNIQNSMYIKGLYMEHPVDSPCTNPLGLNEHKARTYPEPMKFAWCGTGILADLSRNDGFYLASNKFKTLFLSHRILGVDFSPLKCVAAPPGYSDGISPAEMQDKVWHFLPTYLFDFDESLSGVIYKDKCPACGRSQIIRRNDRPAVFNWTNWQGEGVFGLHRSDIHICTETVMNAIVSIGLIGIAFEPFADVVVVDWKKNMREMMGDSWFQKMEQELKNQDLDADGK